MPSKDKTHLPVSRATKARLAAVRDRLAAHYEKGHTLAIDFKPETGITFGQVIDYLLDQWETHHHRAEKARLRRRAHQRAAAGTDPLPFQADL